jgi:hypothetical protein
MSETSHIDKAKGALVAASTLDSSTDPIRFGDLLLIARTQAEVASAAALERIADHLDYLFPHS